MARQKMWAIGSGCGRASWNTTRARPNRLHNNTTMVMVAKVDMAADTNPLLRRNSGLSEGVDATKYITAYCRSFTVGQDWVHETSRLAPWSYRKIGRADCQHHF